MMTVYLQVNAKYLQSKFKLMISMSIGQRCVSSVYLYTYSGDGLITGCQPWHCVGQVHQSSICWLLWISGESGLLVKQPNVECWVLKLPLGLRDYSESSGLSWIFVYSGVLLKNRL